MSIDVLEVRETDRRAIGPRIRALEAGVRYPLGDDEFEIDHGDDYFAFFDRLGEASTFVAMDGDDVVASATGVLRTLERGAAAWYACDLKVAPGYRGRRLPLRMLLAGLRTKYRRCRRGYGVAMLPADGTDPPAVRLSRHLAVIGSAVADQLVFYALDAETMMACEPIVRAHRGPVTYLGLDGRKDLVLRSTGGPMRLRHVQFGPCGSPSDPEPTEGAVHMLCAPVHDPLVGALGAAGVTPSGRGVVLQHGMPRWDWRFILTSDV